MKKETTTPQPDSTIEVLQDKLPFTGNWVQHMEDAAKDHPRLKAENEKLKDENQRLKDSNRELLGALDEMIKLARTMWGDDMPEIIKAKTVYNKVI